MGCGSVSIIEKPLVFHFINILLNPFLQFSLEFRDIDVLSDKALIISCDQPDKGFTVDLPRLRIVLDKIPENEVGSKRAYPPIEAVPDKVPMILCLLVCLQNCPHEFVFLLLGRQLSR